MAFRKRQSAHALMKRNLTLFSRSEEMERRTRALPAEKKLAIIRKYDAITNESARNRERAIRIMQKRVMDSHALPPDSAKYAATAAYNYMINGVPYKVALRRALLRHS